MVLSDGIMNGRYTGRYIMNNTNYHMVHLLVNGVIDYDDGRYILVN